TPAPPPAPPQAKEEPLPAREDALARGVALAGEWPHYDTPRQQAWLAERQLDEATVRRLLTAVARPCLAERAREAEACKALEGSTDAGKAVEALASMLGELADTAAPGGASLKLLLGLQARGRWEAGSAVERVLERRMAASVGACTPPGAAEIEAARRDL